LALVFKNEGHQDWFYWYVAFCVLISLAVYAGMKDTQKHSQIEVGHD
jgi:MHS family alpha-ketoglutarate permease-like MFS transporter